MYGCGETKPKKPRKRRPRRSAIDTGRIRTRQKWVTDNYVMNHVLNTPSPLPEPRSDSRCVFYERIVDTKGLLRDRHNPCYHVRYSEQVLDRPNAVHQVGCTVGADTAPRPDVLTALQTGIPRIPASVLNDCAMQARDHFLNAVKPEMLLVNSILELLTMLKGMAEKATSGIKRIETIKQKAKRYKDALLKRGVSEADADFLTWKFCIEPMLRDLKTLWCSIERAKKRTQWLYKNAGKPVRVHFRKSLGELIPPGTTIPWGAGGFYVDGWNPACPPWVPMCIQPRMDPIDGQYEIRADRVDITFAAQATVIYDLPPFRFDAEGSGLGLVWSSMMSTDRLGSMIWEAIPFSFVIDWCTDLGKHLAKLLDGATKNFPDGVILEEGHSIKLQSVWSVWYVPNACSDEHIGLVRYKVYQRGKGLPVDPDFSFDLGGVNSSLNRTALSSALVTTKYKRFRKRRGRLTR